MWGETLTPKNANYDSFYPIFFSIFTPKFANFCNFSPKNANLDNFSPKKCNFEKFSTSESEKYRESFSQFFSQLGKNYFFWQNIHLWLQLKVINGGKLFHKFLAQQGKHVNYRPLIVHVTFIFMVVGGWLKSVSLCPFL